MHVFDIIGPIMIGPSSSHTAGAARIGRVARRLLDEEPVRARIALYGSFAATARGHGTDRALVAGLLDMGVDDARIRDSFAHAEAAGLSFEFCEATGLRDAHPNTAVIEVEGRSRKLTLRAASVGGGAIRVDELDALPVSFTGSAHTLIIVHCDQPGMIAQVSGLLAYQAVNIGQMQVFRQQLGGTAVMVIEVDAVPSARSLSALNALPGIERAVLLKKL
ncbi:L-serine ammonia-lyase, iron-sulfur-dependent subunit beta [Bacillota bacterium Meth-B3]